MAHESKRRRVVSEYQDAALGDARLTKRLGRLAEALAQSPGSSFPTLATSDGELEATYRFFSNERVSWQAILAPHIAATLDRCAVEKEVVVAHDTTEFEFRSVDEAREGLGYLSATRRGFFGHFALAVSTCDLRTPLGVVGLLPHVRTEAPEKLTASQAVKRSAHKPQDEKESERWRTLARAVETSFEGRARPIHVMDRGADDFVLWANLAEENCAFVIRARFDRYLDKKRGLRMSEALAKCEGQLLREVEVGGQPRPKGRAGWTARPLRTAKLHVRGERMEIPRTRMSQSEHASAVVNVVQVYEVGAPANETPVEWTLLTSEPIETVEQLARVVDLYRARWVVEEFFKALKTGCAYESRQLTSLHALLNALAVFAPLAWRMLALRTAATHKPEAAASTLLPPDELELLKRISIRVPLGAKPTALDVLNAIAGLGGHLKRNGPPGWITLGRGYERFATALIGWRAAR